MPAEEGTNPLLKLINSFDLNRNLFSSQSSPPTGDAAKDASTSEGEALASDPKTTEESIALEGNPQETQKTTEEEKGEEQMSNIDEVIEPAETIEVPASPTADRPYEENQRSFHGKVTKYWCAKFDPFVCAITPCFLWILGG